MDLENSFKLTSESVKSHRRHLIRVADEKMLTPVHRFHGDNDSVDGIHDDVTSAVQARRGVPSGQVPAQEEQVRFRIRH